MNENCLICDVPLKDGETEMCWNCIAYAHTSAGIDPTMEWVDEEPFNEEFDD